MRPFHQTQRARVWPQNRQTDRSTYSCPLCASARSTENRRGNPARRVRAFGDQPSPAYPSVCGAHPRRGEFKPMCGQGRQRARIWSGPSAQRHHFSRRAWPRTEYRPLCHQSPPLLHQVAPLISGLRLVAQRVAKAASATRPRIPLYSLQGTEGLDPVPTGIASRAHDWTTPVRGARPRCRSPAALNAGWTSPASMPRNRVWHRRPLPGTVPATRARALLPARQILRTPSC